MGKKQIEVIEWTCDGCRKTEVHPVGPEDASPPLPEGWVSGTVDLETQGAKWDAHARKACVKNAVQNSLSLLNLD